MTLCRWGRTAFWGFAGSSFVLGFRSAQSLTPSAHAHEAPKALTPRSARCSANGYELTIKVAKRGGMAM